MIGELLRAYREETGDDPKVAVITVPAKFEQSACEGTREAARRAGLLFAHSFRNQSRPHSVTASRPKTNMPSGWSLTSAVGP